MHHADIKPREVVLTDGRLIGMMVVMAVVALLLAVGSEIFKVY